MISFLLFLLCLLGMSLGLFAAVIWLALTLIETLLTCAERSLRGFANGRALSGALYLIPAGLFLYAIVDGGYLAISFFTAVLRP
jgi:hypothetical protein